MSFTLRMGTRGSKLARAQSDLVAAQLEAARPGLRVERFIYKTTGDKILDRPLHEFGGKGLFTKEIEEDLLRGEIDFIVHSCKDVPVTMPLVDQRNLIVGAVPVREDPRDALVSLVASRISELPQGAIVGTGSLRRRCQLLAIRPDLRVKLLRGNVDTRIRAAMDGSFDAVILAMAGLRRSGLFDQSCMFPIPLNEMLPSAGQGALLLQCCHDDCFTRGILADLNDATAARSVQLERAVVAELNGDCHSPIAVLAEPFADGFRLRAAVGARGGNLPVITASASGSASDVLEQVSLLLLEQNALELLQNIEAAGAR